MSAGLFRIHCGQGQTLPRVVLADQVASVKHASGQSTPGIETIETVVVLSSGQPLDCGEPFDVVVEMWARALHDTHGTPGYWRAIAPGKNVKPHPNNPSVEVHGDPLPWRVERVVINKGS